MASEGEVDTPTPGNWPVDPQHDITISKDRIWVDGCFDFAHHGHAGAMLQARRLGKELVVGIHSDEEIMDNKGPTVMTLKERVSAVDACRWASKSVPCAPYVTSLPWISHYGCHYVVHGDDITSDAGGEDCYRFVKAAGRFMVVRRTPGISTTDLVGRMLLCTRNHFIKSLLHTLSGDEGPGSLEERKRLGEEMSQRIRDYATDESGLHPGSQVLSWMASKTAKEGDISEEMGSYSTMVNGKPPKQGQRIVYVDGGFDLFSSGHIEFLRQVRLAEEAFARNSGWYDVMGKDYAPAYIVAGVHDDEVINYWKGINYPIMNLFERGLCVLQCRYIDSVIFSAPFTPSKAYLNNLPYGTPDAVYHGSTSFMPLTHDPYTAARDLNIYREIGNHDFQTVNAGEIVKRIMNSREMYETRQRAKGEKTATEEAVKQREVIEEEAFRLEKDRASIRLVHAISNWPAAPSYPAPMAPTAIQNTSELTSSGIRHTVNKTAPSLSADGTSSGYLSELDASKLIFTRNSNPQEVPEPNSPAVWAQNICSDHMITCQWTSTSGWAAPRLQPYGPLQLMPTASVLHYATECFEGLKFYRGYDLKLRLFRPNRNTRRMLNSAIRISLPAFDPEELQNLIEILVAVDGEKWLPKSRPGTFLYLRPTMIANGTLLGVQKPKEALLYIMACCFPSFDTETGVSGLDPSRMNESPGLRLLASKEDTVRAWPGGFGYAKVGANYGPSLIAQGEARARGFDQVLWLLGKDCDVTEAGASNFFVVWRTREGRAQLITAPLGNKVILDGVTRGSVLELARERLGEDLEVLEKNFTMYEVEEAVEEGRLQEAFAAGTTFFIAPVSNIHFRGKDLEIPMSEGATGKYASILKTKLKNIMYGKEQHEWGVVVKERQLDL